MIIKIDEFFTHTFIVSLRGRLDVTEVPGLRGKLERLLDQTTRQGYVTSFIIDLAGVDFMDTNGLAVLVFLQRRVRINGGEVRLVGPKNQGARRVLHLTRFDRVFEIFESVEAARNIL